MVLAPDKRAQADWARQPGRGGAPRTDARARRHRGTAPQPTHGGPTAAARPTEPSARTDPGHTAGSRRPAPRTADGE